VEVEIKDKMEGQGIPENIAMESLNENFGIIFRWTCSKFLSKYRLANSDTCSVDFLWHTAHMCYFNIEQVFC
jgi:hypothetical protein